MGPAAPGELWPLASAVWSAAVLRGPRGRFGQARLLFCSPPHRHLLGAHGQNATGPAGGGGPRRAPRRGLAT